MIADLGQQWGRFSDHWLDRDAKGLIAIAMGEIGLPSRLLAGAWGMDGTFGIISDGPTSAPGQPPLTPSKTCTAFITKVKKHEFLVSSVILLATACHLLSITLLSKSAP